MTGRARQLFSWCGSRIGEREAPDALRKETHAGLGYRGTNLQNHRKGLQRLRSLKNAVFAGCFEQWTFTPYVAFSRALSTDCFGTRSCRGCFCRHPESFNGISLCYSLLSIAPFFLCLVCAPAPLSGLRALLLCIFCCWHTAVPFFHISPFSLGLHSRPMELHIEL